LAALALPLCALGENLVQNGSFETNGGANSNVLPGWSLVDEEGGSGSWLAQSGTTAPLRPEFNCPSDVPAPPDGTFSAMTTMGAKGSHVLYQDVTIPAGADPVLSFQFFIRSDSGFYAPDSLSYLTDPNQQFRVDVVERTADFFTTNVIQSVLLYGPGNPTRYGYEAHAVTLTGLAGRAVRLRFLEVDNQACFNAGVDNVRLEVPTATPRPAIIKFVADEETIPFAGTGALSWSTQNATSVEIDNDIGPVPFSGSKSVALQFEKTFTLTATGAGGTATRAVHIGTLDPGPTLSLSAAPGFIEPGDPATLTWSTNGATDVSLDNGIGTVGATGSLTVTPSKTTEYTVTAVGSGVTKTARATVFVDPGDVPIVSLVSYPGGVVLVEGSAAPTAQFVLANLGKVATTITLTQTETFFSQTPASFNLAPGATQVVTINFSSKPVGNYTGASLPAGAGVPEGLTVPIELFVAAAPTGTVTPTTAVARTEIAGPANENPSGSVTFTNSGTGALQGIASSDAAWLLPEKGIITIGPGQTKAVSFATDRSLRPDAASLGGAAFATLTLTYAGASAGASRIPSVHGATATRSISVTVVDLVKPGATPGGAPPLAPGEIAYFVPGLFQRANTAGDLNVSVIGTSISDLRLYLAAPGFSSLVGSVDQIAPNSGLALPSILQSVFATAAPTATVQARSASLSRVAVSGLQTNTGSTTGSFITSLPTFRSDRSAGAGEAINLAGMVPGADLFLQEVTGFPATARIEFLDAAGNVLGTPDDQSISAFSLLSLAKAAPSSSASARVTNTSTTSARIVAYALYTDPRTQDAWTIADSTASEQVIAVPPPVGAPANNTIFVFNPNADQVEITTDNRFAGGRRRAVRSNAKSSTEAALVLGAKQSAMLPIASVNGFVALSASRPVGVTARSFSSTSTGGNFGTTLPVFTASDALAAGQSRRFGGVDDAGASTVDARTPVTYRSNLGLVETAGQAAVVRVTLRYTFSAGTRSTASGISSVTVTVPANRLLMLNNIGRAVIGNSRDGYGDLRNTQLDVEVISGRISPFLETVDNGTDDAAIRVQ
jgi:hypothetical protein